MSNEPDVERTFIRQELDRTNAERLLRLETRLDSLDVLVRSSMIVIDEQIKRNIKEIEISISERTIDLAVTKAFEHLGVDVNNPQDLKRFQEDLRFGGIFRDAATKGFFALLVAISGGIGLSLWLSFKQKLGIQ
jgi:hypothetical protein